MIEKLALLKMASCKAPTLSRSSRLRTSAATSAASGSSSAITVWPNTVPFLTSSAVLITHPLLVWICCAVLRDLGAVFYERRIAAKRRTLGGFLRVLVGGEGNPPLDASVTSMR